MLSSVLNSKRAINVNITIMRAFVKVREIIYSNKDLVRKISELEKLTNEKFKNQDKKIGLVFEMKTYFLVIRNPKTFLS
jgi:hypothetical protein